jgi:hypothetical protein
MPNHVNAHFLIIGQQWRLKNKNDFILFDGVGDCAEYSGKNVVWPEFNEGMNTVGSPFQDLCKRTEGIQNSHNTNGPPVLHFPQKNEYGQN